MAGRHEPEAAGRSAPASAPLRPGALRGALVRPGSLWRDMRVVAETGSTNTDLVAGARRGEPEGVVLVAELQRSGRGRLGRDWTAPAGSSLTFSVLLRPDVDPARWAWLPLLAGVAMVEAVQRAGVAGARLKWPNDVLVGQRKLAGILVERAGGAAVVGIGLNVTQSEAELPVPAATSLALEGGRAHAGGYDRTRLLVEVLRTLEHRYGRWRAAAGDPETSGLRSAYRGSCATLGRPVRVDLPGGGVLDGEAVDVDLAGRLVVRTADGVRTVSAGDVFHVR